MLAIIEGLTGNGYDVEKEGGEYPVHECPECEQETLVDTDYVGGDFRP